MSGAQRARPCIAVAGGDGRCAELARVPSRRIQRVLLFCSGGRPIRKFSKVPVPRRFPADEFLRAHSRCAPDRVVKTRSGVEMLVGLQTGCGGTVEHSYSSSHFGWNFESRPLHQKKKVGNYLQNLQCPTGQLKNRKNVTCQTGQIGSENRPKITSLESCASQAKSKISRFFAKQGIAGLCLGPTPARFAAL